jgi:predicted transcriptional regulator YheO
MEQLSSPIATHLVADTIVSLILFAVGFVWGKYKERKSQRGKNLEEYDFYPFENNRENIPEFTIKDFRLGIHYFLKNTDPTAARQLIFIGEQNNVRQLLEPAELRQYEKLFAKYNGKKIADDSSEFLENYMNIVRLFGRTFQNMGFEILLHNLMNPSRSVVCIESGVVTGRNVHAGTTSLVIDLKKRKIRNEDKLNYELNIGARKFKCTTVPIIHKVYGLVGAVCINIDANYITDYVMSSKDKIDAFFRNYLQTDIKLDENILSSSEYQKALKGKKHWRDETI